MVTVPEGESSSSAMSFRPYPATGLRARKGPPGKGGLSIPLAPHSISGGVTSFGGGGSFILRDSFKGISLTPITVRLLSAQSNQLRFETAVLAEARSADRSPIAAQTLGDEAMDGKRAPDEKTRLLWERANRRALYGYSRRIADAIGLSKSYVQEWLKASTGKISPGERLVGLILASREYQDEADADAPLWLAAELLGYELQKVGLEESPSLERADRAVAKILKETGEAAQALLESLEDGVVTDHEAAKVEKEIDEAILALNRARSLVREIEK